MFTNTPLKYSMNPEYPFLKSLITCYFLTFEQVTAMLVIYRQADYTFLCYKQAKVFFKLQRHCFNTVCTFLTVHLFFPFSEKLRNFPFTNWVPSGFSFGVYFVWLFFSFVCIDGYCVNQKEDIERIRFNFHRCFIVHYNYSYK